MRFYRVHMRTEGGASAGFSWHTSLRDAERAKREYDALVDDENDRCDEPQAVDVEPTKDGILRALNDFAGHPDNG